MSTFPVFILSQVLLALTFAGPGAAHLVEAWQQRKHVAMAFSTVELLAGLAMMLGWQVRWLALTAALFLLVDAFAAHDFWNALSQDKSNQLLHFFKNLAQVGSFVLLGAADATEKI